MQLKVSDRNSKLGKIPNLSLSPVKSCGNCEQCKTTCYALKAYRMYPSVRNAWDNNLDLARNNPEIFFADLDTYLEKKKPKFFRWHVSGDIINLAYFSNMITIANNHPDTKFLCFTKMYGTVNRVLSHTEKPDNLAVVFSVWPGLPFYNDHNLPLAFCQDGTETRHIGNDYLECPGYCETCGLCWDLPKTGYNVLFDIH